MMSASDWNDSVPDSYKRPKRNFDNCNECRHRKKRCSWEDARGRRLTKCLACTEGERHCSGPVNIRSRSVAGNNAVHSGRTGSQMLSARNPTEQSSYRQQDGVHVAAVVHNRLSRPLDGMPELADSMESVPLASKSTEGLSTAPRNTLERQCKEGLKQMGDLKAAKYQILRYIHLLQHYRHRGGGTTDVERTLHSLREARTAVEERYYELHTYVKGLIMQGELPKAKETLLLALVSLRERFKHEEDHHFKQGRARNAQSSDADIFQYLHSNRKRDKSSATCSQADYFAGGTPSSTGSFGSLLAGHNKETLEGYVRSSADLKEVLATLDFKDASHRDYLLSPCNGQILSIPPTHLAVQNGCSTLQLQIWQASGVCDWEIDFMHMTPVHHAAYQRDLIKLQDLFQRRPNLAVTDYRDRLGLTPLLITAINDDVPGFRLLVDSNADYLTCTDSQGRGVLALAVQNGSTGIVDDIHRRGILPTSSINELVEALEHGHTTIANKIIDLYASSAQEYQVKTRAREALMLTRLRDELSDLAERLEDLLAAKLPSVSEATNDLLHADYCEYSQAATCSKFSTYDTPASVGTNRMVHNSPWPEQAHGFGLASPSRLPDWHSGPSFTDQSLGSDLESQSSQWLSPNATILSLSQESNDYNPY